MKHRFPFAPRLLLAGQAIGRTWLIGLARSTCHRNGCSQETGLIALRLPPQAVFHFMESMLIQQSWIRESFVAVLDLLGYLQARPSRH